jgi:hypothetical protein
VQKRPQVERVSGSVLPRQVRQLHIGDAGQHLVQVHLISIVFHQKAAGQHTDSRLDADQIAETFEDFASDSRVAVQAADGDARSPQGARPTVVHDGRQRLVFRQPRRILLGRAQDREQGILVRRLGIEADQDVAGEGIGLNPLQWRNSSAKHTPSRG